MRKVWTHVRQDFGINNQQYLTDSVQSSSTRWTEEQYHTKFRFVFKCICYLRTG